jgi:hypothetical protein
MDNLGLNPIRGSQISSSIGYITIPYDVNRDQFVETCMRKGVCSVYRENSFGIINNVRIGIEEIQLIDWPKESGQLGSAVVMVLEPFHKIYNVVAVVATNGEVLKAKEGVRIITKETEKGRVSIILDANRPIIQILSENGDIELISTDGKVNVVSNVEVFVKSPKIKHNDADEPMLRGQKVVDLLDELITLLFNARTATSIGLQPLNNFVQINELKTKLEELKSVKSFLE